MQREVLVRPTTLDLLGIEIEASVRYVIHSYGTPETGRFGRPEDYDPGAGPEIEILSVTSDTSGQDFKFLLSQITGEPRGYDPRTRCTMLDVVEDETLEDLPPKMTREDYMAEMYG